MLKACVLRTGGIYGPQHVQWLARQIPGLVCLSDIPVCGVPTIELQYHWPGWWSKMELFGPLIDDDILFFDLDTVIVGDIGRLCVGKTTALRDFYYPDMFASGLMYIRQEDKRAVWMAWLKHPASNMARHRRLPSLGDQGFLSTRLTADRWQDVLPGQIVSYKVHCKDGVPPGAAVVCFHGKPKPWDVTADWIPKL